MEGSRGDEARRAGTASVGLIEDLQPGPAALDAAIFIYFIEEDARLLPIVEPVFQAMERGVLECVTSALNFA